MAPQLTPSGHPPGIEVSVLAAADIPQAVGRSRSFAGSLGFPEHDCDEIGLVVSELSSNLIRHASGGLLKLVAFERERMGIEICAVDNGPGIGDVEQAIVDGYSTAGGLGAGLGTVNRLMDELELYSGPAGGLHVICRRWIRAAPAARAARVLRFGVATRSCRNLPENGDAFLVKQWDSMALVGVIDGLGHGQFAQRAAQTARVYLEQHFDQPLTNLFRGVGRACRATRGVVMALARIDLKRACLAIANVGNVEVRLLGAGAPFRPLIRRGVIGWNAPNAATTEHEWTPGSLLIIHSDGLRSHWSEHDFSGILGDSPEVTARRLLRVLGKPEDDATVVVARGAE